MSEKTRILVITPQYAPDFGPSAPIYTALCEDLGHYGCDVTVITGFPHYGGAAEHFPYSGKFLVEENINGVRVIRMYIYSAPQNSLWKRLIYHISVNLSFSIATLRVNKPDVILADAPVLWSGLPLIVSAIIRRVPFIYVVHDIYPDVLVRLSILKDGLIVKVINSIEGVFYRLAAQISVLSEGFKRNLIGKHVSAEKILTIPIGVDTELICPLPLENELRTEWGLTGKFVVLYAGNIGLSQGLEIVLGAANLLRERSEITFVLVGEGADKSNLQAKALELELNNVRFYPFQPRDKVPMVYSLADVSLVSLKKNVVTESVPSKTYTIMASSRPIIAAVNEDTEIGQLIDVVSCGLRVEPENSTALANAILQLQSDTLLRTQLAERGRSYIVSNYSRKVIAEKYLAMIDNVIKKGVMYDSSVRTHL